MLAASFLAELKVWAATRSDIRALALVGSHARGEARPDSDIDLVLLCSEPGRYLENPLWVADLGEVATVAREDWGKVQSLRVFYRDGLEVEFGVTATDWAAIPPDQGTVEVIRNGLSILVDRDGALFELARIVKPVR